MEALFEGICCTHSSHCSIRCKKIVFDCFICESIKVKQTFVLKALTWGFISVKQMYKCSFFTLKRLKERQNEIKCIRNVGKVWGKIPKNVDFRQFIVGLLFYSLPIMFILKNVFYKI